MLHFWQKPSLIYKQNSIIPQPIIDHCFTHTPSRMMMAITWQDPAIPSLDLGSTYGDRSAMLLAASFRNYTFTPLIISFAFWPSSSSP